jgi:hypothetical protein
VIARVVLWSLADADATFGELRDALDNEPADVPGRLFEAWISDESSERWGTLSVFASREAADRAPTGRIGELIGKAPDLYEEFDVETTAQSTSVSGNEAPPANRSSR